MFGHDSSLAYSSLPSTRTHVHYVRVGLNVLGSGPTVAATALASPSTEDKADRTRARRRRGWRRDGRITLTRIARTAASARRFPLGRGATRRPMAVCSTGVAAAAVRPSLFGCLFAC